MIVLSCIFPDPIGSPLGLMRYGILTLDHITFDG